VPDKAKSACIDGNEAAARVAHALSEVVAIYPITPASPMGEHADAWSAAGRKNLWGSVPHVVEMQSEAGAAGALHGAAQKGALATTFTSSQGLLLMLPTMYRLAGELVPSVIHVAARAIATHALSIFGDHSDVMAARSTGLAILGSASPQEAHDFALAAHAATLESRVPFLHFFDGFRTSHEVNHVDLLTDDDLRAVVDEGCVLEHRARGLSPDHPVLRGSSQNPDVFFQSREAANLVYERVPAVVQAAFDRIAARTGRRYGLVEYIGAPDAERVLVLMGSAIGAAEETVEALQQQGEKVGVVKVRLFRPFPSQALLDALPHTATRVAVLDRTKEPGSVGEPLYLDVVAALSEAGRLATAQVVGCRYGLASKEVTPAMLAGLFAELARPEPRPHTTIGIVDDVTHTGVAAAAGFVTERAEYQAVFYGLGSDGTVGASKQTVKILGEDCGYQAQGYFVYDSKKAGTLTVSHVRFGHEPIRSTYLVQQADYVGVHQWQFVDKVDVLDLARPGATVLLNATFPADKVWDHLPRSVQQQVIDKHLDLWAIDAYRLAADEGLGRRINTIMEAAFFALADVLPHDRALALMREGVERSYGKRGPDVVARNVAAIDAAAHALHHIGVPSEPNAIDGAAVSDAPGIFATLLAGRGDDLPVSAMPVDGTFPTGTAKWERRSLAQAIPAWDPSLCIDCGKCTIVCPHAAIRMKVFEPGHAAGAPAQFQTKEFRSREVPGKLLSIQVAPDDCTGCGVCVEVCPAHDKADKTHKSLNLVPADGVREQERQNWAFFQGVPDLDHGLIAPDSVKGSQVRLPLFEFSGACAGCGETPYLKLLTQLFGDRAIIANATGCSSIYGGNLPTTPWTTNAGGHGPAWENSLFEDNAEFGMGIRVALDQQGAAARDLLLDLAPLVGMPLAESILDADQSSDTDIAAQRERVRRLKAMLASLNGSHGAGPAQLASLADELVRRSVWLVGGDGWAYDIGSAGLDHVLASGRNVNVLVLDTEVYSNTGGQASKATPRGAVARFASAGKATAKKDLGMIAMQYGDVYVAHVSMGANDLQTVKAFIEADAWPGPSLIIAYASCVPAHGFDESQSMAHQRDAARSGYWPLYRYRPGEAEPFTDDSRKPTMTMRDFAASEERFASLMRTQPERADALLAQGEADVASRRKLYERLMQPSD
jgi:pyruvate-ferredoxin/flavodoxin oxidoreductase